MDADQLKLRRQVDQLFGMIEETQKLATSTARAQDTRHTAIMPGEAIQILDADGNVSAYFGGSNESGQLIEYVDGPIPAKPSAPEVDSPMSGVVSVFADGFDVAGAGVAGNHRRVLIHMSHEAGFVASEGTVVHWFAGPEGRQDLIVTPGEWYVAIQWESQTGQLSELSEIVPVEVVTLVDTADIQAALEDAQTRLDEAKAEFEAGNEERKTELEKLHEVVLPGLQAVLAEKADSSQLGTLDQALRDAFGEADDAVAQAAATDAQARATAAREAAEAEADRLAKAEAQAAQSAAEATAAQDAATKAQKAYDDAVASAAGDATAKADAAKQAAEVAAALDATAKTEAAEAAAALDATAKANAAQAAAQTEAERLAGLAQDAAVAAAALDATAKAEAAEARAATEALRVAKAEAEEKADAAEAAAKAYADLKAAGEGGDALDAAKEYADAQADAARIAAENAAALDATAKMEQAEAEAAIDAKAKADQALADAKADATAKANTAERLAKEAAALDATAKAEAAEAEAARLAALDATAKADAARQAAEAAASTDATAKSDAAQAAAEAEAARLAGLAEEAAKTAAATDAKAKADAAQAEAIRQAALDATAKADAAKTAAEDAAKQYADQQDVILKGEAAADAQTKADEAVQQAETLMATAITEGSNLIVDGGFEAGDQHWQTNANMFTIATPEARTGSRVMLLDLNGANRWPRTLHYIPVETGRTYRFTAWFKMVSGEPTTVGFVPRTQHADGTSSPGRSRLAGLSVGDGWVKVTHDETVTYEGATLMDPAPWVLGRPDTIVWVDDFTMHDVTEAKTALDAANAAQATAEAAHTEAGTAWTHADAAMTRAGAAETNAIEEAGRLADAARAVADEAKAENRIQDTRNDNYDPQHYYTLRHPARIIEFKRTTAIGLTGALGGTYVHMITHISWGDPSGGPIRQEAIDGQNNVWTRVSLNRDDWGPWANKLAEAEAAAKQHADNLPKVLHGTGAPSGTAPNGSIWWRHQGTLHGAVIGQWNRVNGAWRSTPISSEAIANLDVGKLTAGGATISSAVIQDLKAANGAFDRLDARTGWIGEVALESGAVSARAINTDEVFANTAVVDKIFAEAVRARLLTAEEAIIGGALLEKNSITVDKLTGLEQIMTALLTARKIAAGDIKVNELWASEAWLTAIEASNIRLASVIDDWQTYITGRGMEVISPEGQPAVQLGNYEETGLTLYRDGEATASMSDDGHVSGTVVSANEEFHYQGTELSELIDTSHLPRGAVAWGEINMSGKSYTAPTHIGFLEVSFDAEPGRAYQVVVSPYRVSQATFQRIVMTFNGASPNISMNDQSSTQWVYTAKISDEVAGGTWRVPVQTTEKLVRILIGVYKGGVAGINFPNVTGHVIATVHDMGLAAENTGVARSSTVVPGGSNSPDPKPPVTKTRRTSTWNMSWWRTWWQNGNIPGSGVGVKEAAQGRTPYFTSAGTYRSQIGFPSMTSTLSGADIEKIEVRVRVIHSHAGSGGNVRLGTHSNSSRPSSYTGASNAESTNTAFGRGQEKWITLPSRLYNGFKNGTYRGVTMFTSSTSSTYYVQANPSRFAIRVTYRK